MGREKKSTGDSTSNENFPQRWKQNKDIFRETKVTKISFSEDLLQHCSGEDCGDGESLGIRRALLIQFGLGKAPRSYFPCQVRLVMAACSLGQRGTVRLCPHSQGKRTRQTDNDGVAERWASHSNYGYVRPRHSMSNLMSHPRFTMQAD